MSNHLNAHSQHCKSVALVEHRNIQQSKDQWNFKKRTNVAVADCQGNLLSTGMNE